MVIEGAWYAGWDGEDLQNLAAMFHLLRPVPYDPLVHGDNDVGAEAGDPWFEFVEPEIE